MIAIMSFSEAETEALYYALSYVFSEDGFEFVDEDERMNAPLEKAFNKVINAFENMHAPIDNEEKKYLEERFK